MKHLVVTVSTDSSVQLLASFADVILLDKPPTPIELNSYDTLYIRSVFSQDTTLPQLFRSQIDTLVRLASRTNPTIYYIDDMDTVDQILTFEDKWHEYQTLGEFMPSTQVYDTPATALHFAHSVFKKRLSSRGTGVTWNRQNVTDPFSEWIVQDSLDIAEELRIYAIRGTVYPIAAVRQSKTHHQKTRVTDIRQLTRDEIDFSTKIHARISSIDLLGIDIARTVDGKLHLIEVNRSPGFAAFTALTNVNLSGLLYSAIEAQLPTMSSTN